MYNKYNNNNNYQRRDVQWQRVDVIEIIEGKYVGLITTYNPNTGEVYNYQVAKHLTTTIEDNYPAMRAEFKEQFIKLGMVINDRAHWSVRHLRFRNYNSDGQAATN